MTDTPLFNGLRQEFFNRHWRLDPSRSLLIGTASAGGSPVSGLSRRRLGEDGSGWRPACESRRGDIPRSEGR